MSKQFFSCLLVAGLAFVAGTVYAQTPMEAPAEALPALGSSEGVAVGPFIFTPNVNLQWENRDNIFFTPDNEVSDDVYVARARLMFELPVYDSYIRLSYTPQYRDYGTYNLRENWSHFVNLDGAFDFSSGLKLKVGYRYVSGNLETREVDPGGELAFGDRQFTKHEAKVEADYWVSPTNGIAIEGSFDKLNYPDRTLFYDYSRGRAGIGWIHQVSPTLTFGLKYRHENFNAEDTADYRDSSSDEVTLSLDGKVSPVLSSTLELGYRSTNFDNAPGKPNFSDYSGLVARGSLSLALAHGGLLTLHVTRMDYPSNFDRNAFYTATEGGLTYRLERDRLFGYLRADYQNNDYEVPDTVTGRSRSDDLTTYGVGVGYRLTDLLALRGSYTHQKTRFPASLLVRRQHVPPGD
jgi:Uncharacterized protein conserved in bacteria (DUF2320).